MAEQRMHASISNLSLGLPAGLEQVTARELASKHIGAFGIQPGKAGVHFRQGPHQSL